MFLLRGVSCNIASPVDTLFQVIVDFKYKMPLMPCILTLLFSAQALAFKAGSDTKVPGIAQNIYLGS